MRSVPTIAAGRGKVKTATWWNGESDLIDEARRAIEERGPGAPDRALRRELSVPGRRRMPLDDATPPA